MLNIDKFISQHVTHRQQSLFAGDIQNHYKEIESEVKGHSLLVIGGAGSIGSSFIKDFSSS